MLVLLLVQGPPTDVTSAYLRGWQAAGEAAFSAEAKSVVLHALVLDGRMMVIGADFEGHEVAQAEAAGLL